VVETRRSRADIFGVLRPLDLGDNRLYENDHGDGVFAFGHHDRLNVPNVRRPSSATYQS
jgi:hypothetical protein